MTLTTTEIRSLIEALIEGITADDDSLEGETALTLTRALDDGDISNADVAALIETAINEHENDVAVSLLENALEFLDGTAVIR